MDLMIYRQPLSLHLLTADSRQQPQTRATFRSPLCDHLGNQRFGGIHTAQRQNHDEKVDPGPARKPSSLRPASNVSIRGREGHFHSFEVVRYVCNSDGSIFVKFW